MISAWPSVVFRKNLAIVILAEARIHPEKGWIPAFARLRGNDGFLLECDSNHPPAKPGAFKM
jgi:hypothetical protein